MGPKPTEMTEDDLDGVLAIERASFLTPWARSHFVHEIRANPYAWNLVVRGEDGVAAFASVWILDDELQINNIAVAPAQRRRGLARSLLTSILEEAGRRGCRAATLEVRPSNAAARALYAAFGFRQVGTRKAYYEDTGEDALVLARGLAPVAPP